MFLIQKPFASGNISGSLTGGWNLIANPYMSDISIDLTDPSAWTPSNNSGASYVYDAANRDFVTCNNSAGNCVIPAFQGFWIQATGTPSLAINEGAKISSATNNTSLMRVAQSNVVNVKNYITIKLKSASVTNTTNTIIRYVNGASLGHDNFDAYKLGATNRSCLPGVVVCLYTKAIDSVFYSINAKPYGLTSDTTQMNVVAPDGSTTLDFSDISNLEPKYKITLIDNYTHTNTNVSANPLYNFAVTNSDTNSWGPRFRVVFTDISNVTTGVADKSFNNGFAEVYPSPGTADKINVYLSTADTDAEFSVYDLTGRLIFNSKLNVIDKKAFQVFDLSRILQSGIYSTVIKSNNSSYSQKLIIR